jgi:energy-coupling factor transporter ATP-binding protein EcfA2
VTDVTLLSLVAERLARDPPPDGSASLIVAALKGETDLQAALSGVDTTPVRPSAGADTTQTAVYLTSLVVEGFRGVGPAATLTLAPGPGLTLIVGRNGSGKSSFSEALEMLLLGTNQRWEKRSKVWMDGWQNLHHRHTRITATFAVDGRRAPLTVSREWTEGASVGESTLFIDGKPGGLDLLGWPQALASFPPLLSHNELEHALDEGPTRLHDALAGILGLGDLAEAQHALRQQRLELDHDRKQAQAAAKQLSARLQLSDDERGLTARAALQGKTWDLEALQRVVGGAAMSDERSILMRLRNLASLPVLDTAVLSDVVEELRAGANDMRRRSETEAARAHETALLLEQALRVHAHGDDQTCPVCGTIGVLTYEWRQQANERVAELRSAASDFDAARARVTTAMRQARQLVTALPAALRDAGGLGVDIAAAVESWQAWTQPPDGEDPIRLASHLEVRGTALSKAVASVRRLAGVELERREASWRPVVQSIIEWLPLGQRAATATPRVQRIEKAERWLRDAHDELRDERFRPIAHAVQANWTVLRQDSNVSLGELRLEGASTQRRLKLDVKVDGEPGSALGVMSQGELNCLALSLFLPRAAMPESPFHFLVVDDPVQAMDPAKVEGLATVLAQAAQQRQVIVLTHDDRLADAVRFLDIEATVIEVTRRENSVVELRRIQDPVQRYIDDAFAVAKTEGLPPEAVRVVPGFCRLALEAAASLAVTRRMLREGRRHADVQAALAEATTLNRWLALALLKDVSRAGEVGTFLEKHHPWALQPVRECNRGAHGAELTRDLLGFIRAVERLTKVVLEET